MALMKTNVSCRLHPWKGELSSRSLAQKGGRASESDSFKWEYSRDEDYGRLAVARPFRSGFAQHDMSISNI